MPRRDPKRWKPNRRQRRVLTVLMTGAPGLSGYPIQKLAQTGSATVYITLYKLEDRGWVTGEWETPNPLPQGHGRRRFYTLTPQGRVNVARMLGMASGYEQ